MFRKITALLIIFCLAFEQSGFAQVAPQINIPAYLTGFLSPDRFRPVHLRSFSIDPTTNNINLTLDKGDTKTSSPDQIQEASRPLFEYFQIGLTLPNSMFWVNLRPDDPANIIDPYVEKTDLGRILLEADLQLKKDMSAMTSPDTKEGRAYWDKLYAKAESLFGQEDISVPTVTRPWIVPGEIIMAQSQDSAYVYKATLKVMLEQDYLKDAPGYNSDDPRLQELNTYSSQIIRDVILPKLTREVNSAKRYAGLRQVYYSLILAQWYKQKMPASTIVRIDSRNLDGLTSKQQWSKQTYYQAYKKSFEQGEYNREETVNSQGGLTIRRYFSGGIKIVPSSIEQSDVMILPQKIAGSAITPVTVPLNIGTGAYTVNVAVQAESVPFKDGGTEVKKTGNERTLSNKNADELFEKIRAVGSIRKAEQIFVLLSPLGAADLRFVSKEYSRRYPSDTKGRFINSVFSMTNRLSQDRLASVTKDGGQKKFYDIKEAAQALELRNKANALSNKGVEFFKAGKLEDAIRLFKEAIAIDPTYGHAHHNLAGVYYEQKKLTQAISEYEIAISLEPDYADTYVNYAMTLLYIGRLEETINASDKAIALDGINAKPYLYKGTASYMLGREQEAIEAFSQSVIIDPNMLQGVFIVTGPWGAKVLDYIKSKKSNDNAESNDGGKISSGRQILSTERKKMLLREVGDLAVPADGWEGYDGMPWSGNLQLVKAAVEKNLNSSAEIKEFKDLVRHRHHLRKVAERIVLAAMVGGAVSSLFWAGANPALGVLMFGGAAVGGVSSIFFIAFNFRYDYHLDLALSDLYNDDGTPAVKGTNAFEQYLESSAWREEIIPEAQSLISIFRVGSWLARPMGAYAKPIARLIMKFGLNDVSGFRIQTAVDRYFWAYKKAVESGYYLEHHGESVQKMMENDFETRRQLTQWNPLDFTLTQKLASPSARGSGRTDGGRDLAGRDEAVAQVAEYVKKAVGLKADVFRKEISKKGIDSLAEVLVLKNALVQQWKRENWKLAAGVIGTAVSIGVAFTSPALFLPAIIGLWAGAWVAISSYDKGANYRQALTAVENDFTPVLPGTFPLTPRPDDNAVEDKAPVDLNEFAVLLLSDDLMNEFMYNSLPHILLARGFKRGDSTDNKYMELFVTFRKMGKVDSAMLDVDDRWFAQRAVGYIETNRDLFREIRVFKDGGKDTLGDPREHKRIFDGIVAEYTGKPGDQIQLTAEGINAIAWATLEHSNYEIQRALENLKLHDRISYDLQLKLNLRTALVAHEYIVQRFTRDGGSLDAQSDATARPTLDTLRQQIIKLTRMYNMLPVAYFYIPILAAIGLLFMPASLALTMTIPLAVLFSGVLTGMFYMLSAALHAPYMMDGIEKYSAETSPAGMARHKSTFYWALNWVGVNSLYLGGIAVVSAGLFAGLFTGSIPVAIIAAVYNGVFPFFAARETVKTWDMAEKVIGPRMDGGILSPVIGLWNRLVNPSRVRTYIKVLDRHMAVRSDSREAARRLGEMAIPGDSEAVNALKRYQVEVVLGDMYDVATEAEDSLRKLGLTNSDFEVMYLDVVKNTKFSPMIRRNAARILGERVGGQLSLGVFSIYTWETDMIVKRAMENAKLEIIKRLKAPIRTDSPEVNALLDQLNAESFIGQLEGAANGASYETVKKIGTGKLADLGFEFLKGEWVNRLGWTTTNLKAILDGTAGRTLDDVIQDGKDLQKQGKYVIFAGMGGSGLTVQVVKDTFKNKASENIYSLRTTDPTAITLMLMEIAKKEGNFKKALEETVVVLTSKSATTPETVEHRKYFEKVYNAWGLAPEKHLWFITDTISPWGVEAQSNPLMRQREIQLNGRGDVGGRYTAPGTNVFLLPMAVVAPDSIKPILEKSIAMNDSQDAQDDAFLRLGAYILHMARDLKKDKLTIIVPPDLKAFPMWLEQLIEESLGKSGKGITLFYDEPGLDISSLQSVESNDRVFLRVNLGAEKPRSDLWKHLDENGYPIYEINLNDLEDIGGLMLGMQRAVSVVGYLWDICFVNQPAVEGYKIASKQMEAEIENAGGDVIKVLHDIYPASTKKGAITLYYDSLIQMGIMSKQEIQDTVRSLKSTMNDPAAVYAAVLFALHDKIEAGEFTSYGNMTDNLKETFENARSEIFTRGLKMPAKLGIGPDKNHSYQQNIEDGKNMFFSTYFLPLQAVQPQNFALLQGTPAFSDNMIKAQTLGTVQSMIKNNRKVVLITSDLTAQGSEADMAAFFHAVSDYLAKANLGPDGGRRAKDKTVFKDELNAVRSLKNASPAQADRDLLQLENDLQRPWDVRKEIRSDEECRSLMGKAINELEATGKTVQISSPEDWKQLNRGDIILRYKKDGRQKWLDDWVIFVGASVTGTDVKLSYESIDSRGRVSLNFGDSLAYVVERASMIRILPIIEPMKMTMPIAVASDFAEVTGDYSNTPHPGLTDQYKDASERDASGLDGGRDLQAISGAAFLVSLLGGIMAMKGLQYLGYADLADWAGAGAILAAVLTGIVYHHSTHAGKSDADKAGFDGGTLAQRIATPGVILASVGLMMEMSILAAILIPVSIPFDYLFGTFMGGISFMGGGALFLGGAAKAKRDTLAASQPGAAQPGFLRKYIIDPLEASFNKALRNLYKLYLNRQSSSKKSSDAQTPVDVKKDGGATVPLKDFEDLLNSKDLMRQFVNKYLPALAHKYVPGGMVDGSLKRALLEFRNAGSDVADAELIKNPSDRYQAELAIRFIQENTKKDGGADVLSPKKMLHGPDLVSPKETATRAAKDYLSQQAPANNPDAVLLKNGTEGSRFWVRITMIRLRNISAANFYAIVSKCYIPEYKPSPEAAKLFDRFGWIEADGTMHQPTRNIIMSSVKAGDHALIMVSPISGTEDEPEVKINFARRDGGHQWMDVSEDIEAISSLTGKLNSVSPQERASAARALGARNALIAAPELIAALKKEETPFVRYAIADALAKVDKKSLEGLLKEGNSVVRNAADKALSDLRRKKDGGDISSQKVVARNISLFNENEDWKRAYSNSKGSAIITTIGSSAKNQGYMPGIFGIIDGYGHLLYISNTPELVDDILANYNKDLYEFSVGNNMLIIDDQLVDNRLDVMKILETTFGQIDKQMVLNAGINDGGSDTPTLDELKGADPVTRVKREADASYSGRAAESSSRSSGEVNTGDYHFDGGVKADIQAAIDENVARIKGNKDWLESYQRLKAEPGIFIRGNCTPSGKIEMISSNFFPAAFVDKKSDEKYEQRIEFSVNSEKVFIVRNSVYGVVANEKMLEPVLEGTFQALEKELSGKRDGGLVPAATGGIDLRALPVDQPSGAATLSAVVSGSEKGQLSVQQLESTWTDIEHRIQSGPMPYDTLKTYAIACCQNKDAADQREKLAACIANILKLEEQAAVTTAPELKEILIALS